MRENKWDIALHLGEYARWGNLPIANGLLAEFH